ncbi:hypothetical protein ES706_02367 [subsurface metagenome]
MAEFAGIRWSQVLAGALMGLIIAGLWATVFYAPSVAQAWYDTGYEAGKAVVPVVVVPQALTLARTPDNWDFAIEVASDGSVSAAAAENTENVALTITHAGTVSINNLTITMRDPVTAKDGIPSDLEIASFEIYIKTDASLIPIYKDATYLSYVKPVTVAGEVISVVVQATLKQSPAGTFKDNQSYSLTLYVYQPEASYSNSVTVAVLT